MNARAGLRRSRRNRCAPFADSQRLDWTFKLSSNRYPDSTSGNAAELVHHALEHICVKLAHDSTALQALSPHAQHQLLDEAAGRALAIVCRQRDPGTRWRLRERGRLQNLLTVWLDVERPRMPFVVQALEEQRRSGTIRRTRFSGVRIDRVDRLPDGSTGVDRLQNGAWRRSIGTAERPGNPQLPIYALLRPESLIAVAYARVNAAEPGFVAESEQAGCFPS